MAALNFPASPVVNDTYPNPPISGKPVYRYDGEKWVAEPPLLYVVKTGDTMTGPLNVVHPPTLDPHAASKKYVDDRIGGIPAGNFPTMPSGGAGGGPGHVTGIITGSGIGFYLPPGGAWMYYRNSFDASTNAHSGNVVAGTNPGGTGICEGISGHGWMGWCWRIY